MQCLISSLGFFSYLTYFFLGILPLYVWPILYDRFPIFLLHFWCFKLGKFFVFIMFRTISGCSQIIDDNRVASASSLRGRQIFFPLLSNQKKNCFLVTINYSLQVHSFSSISVKLIQILTHKSSLLVWSTFSPNAVFSFFFFFSFSSC